MSHTIRVVIVDDSALMQRMLTEILQQDPAIHVISTASNGREAIEKVERLRPDIVTMDVRMPVMDGLATTEHIMAYCPTPILVLTASLGRHDIDITFKMLGAGALDVVEKPSATDPAALARVGYDIIRRVKLLSRVKVVRHLRGRRRVEDLTLGTQRYDMASASYARVATSAVETKPQAPVVDAPTFPVVLIGASTGGPRIVNQILRELPAEFPAAVVVVQHIAEGFSAGMAEWLAYGSRMPVAVAHEGTVIQPGVVLIAPDRCDMLIQPDSRVHLSRSSLLIQRPSVDVAMQAAASVYGTRCVGVLLTGMGRDGAYGLLTMRRAGAYTIAQDEATSAIFGMPKAAIDLGAAREVLPAGQIAARLIELVQTHANSA